MFTGLVEQQATLVRLSNNSLVIRPQRLLDNPVRGESIAVNGCCLTLEKWTPSGEYEFHTMAETLKRTNLGSFKPGAYLNIERALKADARLGGHIVQGHIDTVGTVLSLGEVSDGDIELVISIPQSFAWELVEKGGIAIDGVSLTVAWVKDDSFAVRLIPETLSVTAIAKRKKGDLVNLEGDIIGKYVRRMLELSGRIPTNETSHKKSNITWKTLEEAGFL
jgi:riboflavin synthase